jgi:hypothetical protein
MVVQQNLEFLKEEVDKIRGNTVRGSASISNPNTTVVVNHGLGNAVYSVAVTPVNGDVGSRWWVNLKTATQFTIYVQTTPGGTIIFDWIVRGV